jgi:hypothetical protein
MKAAAYAAVPSSLGMLPMAEALEAVVGPRIMAAIVDDDHIPARGFAHRASQQGIPVIPIRSGDITEAWLNSVRPAWQQGRARIAGLTTPAALFCFEQMALSHGLRVVFHAEHVLLPEGRVLHQVQRASVPVSTAALSRAKEQWPQRLADSLVNQGSVTSARPGLSLAGLAPTLPEGALLLTSWIIA